MIDPPFHPMVVHFPIVLTILAPVVIAAAYWVFLNKGWNRHHWAPVVAMLAFILVSAFTAAQLGEADEELVEKVVAESKIDAHEEWGERVVLGSGIAFLLSLAALFMNKRNVLIPLVLAASLVNVISVAAAGDSGGKLVYTHGAAKAFYQKQGPLGGGTFMKKDDHDDH